ncbi:hypothetical protein PoB_003397800 [Plakobranchus ocellatus]|uniref:Uncharacterized protein n=1 Tax=Plakobranchus ocellatus TaxID=259542 RepID=A0AAV4AL04_9GAST|nr:hypothetical protein PoB_003397800 [Plakobranchus ocellatus]
MDGSRLEPVYNKVISGDEALHQARALLAGLEPATKGSLLISSLMTVFLDFTALGYPTPPPRFCTLSNGRCVRTLQKEEKLTFSRSHDLMPSTYSERDFDFLNIDHIKLRRWWHRG